MTSAEVKISRLSLASPQPQSPASPPPSPPTGLAPILSPSSSPSQATPRTKPGLLKKFAQRSLQSHIRAALSGDLLAAGSLRRSPDDSALEPIIPGAKKTPQNCQPDSSASPVLKPRERTVSASSADTTIPLVFSMETSNTGQDSSSSPPHSKKRPRSFPTSSCGTDLEHAIVNANQILGRVQPQPIRQRSTVIKTLRPPSKKNKPG